MVRNALDRPFARALLAGDADLLGALAGHPRSKELLDRLGPAGLMDTVLPIWRKYRLVRTDWSLDAQAYALQALMTGFIQTTTSMPVLRGVPIDTPDTVMAAAVTALLGTETASPTDVRAAAQQGVQLLRERRDAVLTLITTNHETTEKKL
ncbi:hypothetical protein FHX44_118215 [Pseudonocardia hierapolitana]|uniref:Uncharacterized protein n=1 Tax=Pseudonocardia hierapolitana TaxID=1128676 RepID=A0A561T588_9PSEU|nr:hypothetical protein [Pseudonocardia hierapolitana]TWF82270.1 hypothetical protein FHX44_118215 [Pseudonocardia hierapolitana]